MELILQLAQAEDSSPASKDIPSLSATSTAASDHVDYPLPAVPKSVIELYALEELEKELGLGDLTLLTASSASIITSSSSTSGAGDGSGSNTNKNDSGIGSGDVKEAGDDISIATPAPPSSASAAPTTTAQQDDDNLDELEKYLQSLTAN